MQRAELGQPPGTPCKHVAACLVGTVELLQATRVPVDELWTESCGYNRSLRGVSWMIITAVLPQRASEGGLEARNIDEKQEAFDKALSVSDHVEEAQQQLERAGDGRRRTTLAAFGCVSSRVSKEACRGQL